MTSGSWWITGSGRSTRIAHSLLCHHILLLLWSILAALLIRIPSAGPIIRPVLLRCWSRILVPASHLLLLLLLWLWLHLLMMLG